MRHALPPTLFFFIGFNLILVTKQLILQEHGVEYQTLVFEDEGHGISRPKNQKVLYERLAAFFEGAFASK